MEFWTFNTEHIQEGETNSRIDIRWTDRIVIIIVIIINIIIIIIIIINVNIIIIILIIRQDKFSLCESVWRLNNKVKGEKHSKVKEIKKLIHQLNWYKKNMLLLLFLLLLLLLLILLFTYIILVIRDIWILICKCEHVQPAQWKN